MQNVHRRTSGFTLVEIMAVVVIIGLLTGIVGVTVVGRINEGRVTSAKVQIKNIEGALEFYQIDNGRYPTTEQGLRALVEKPTSAPEPRRWKPEGYLRGSEVPVDPWGQPYQYQQPGTQNPYSFDIWSLGSDGSPGGEGADADIGNWSSGES